MNIAILSRNKNLYSTNRLFNAGTKRGHRIDVIDYLRCYINIGENQTEIYYNGKKLGSKTTNSTAFQSSMKTFSIAKSSHSNGHMSDMKVSSAMLYEKCLSESEVQQNFDAHKGRFGI